MLTERALGVGAWAGLHHTARTSTMLRHAAGRVMAAAAANARGGTTKLPAVQPALTRGISSPTPSCSQSGARHRHCPAGAAHAARMAVQAPRVCALPARSGSESHGLSLSRGVGDSVRESHALTPTRSAWWQGALRWIGRLTCALGGAKAAAEPAEGGEQPVEGPAVGAYPKTAEDPHGVGPLRKWGAKTMERRTQIARMADRIMHMSLKEADELVDRFLHILRRPGRPGVLAVTVYATKLNLQNFSLRLQHSLVRPSTASLTRFCPKAKNPPQSIERRGDGRI
jgi:hypothetical protein